MAPEIGGQSKKAEEKDKEKNGLSPSSEEIANLQLARLRAGGVEIDNITVKSLNDLGMTVSEFEKLLSVMMPYTGQGLLLGCVLTSWSKKVISDYNRLNLLDLTRLCHWLRKTEGINAMRELTKTDRIMKRGKQVFFSKMEKGYLALWEAQFGDYSSEVYRKRAKREDKIAELQDEIRRLESDNSFVDKLKRKFEAVGTFVEPTKAEKAERAWEMYIAECNQISGRLPVAKTKENIEKYCSGFFQDVEKEYKTIHCRKKYVKDDLEKFCKEKLREFYSVKDQRQIGTFQTYHFQATGQRIDVDALVREGLRKESDPESGREGKDTSVRAEVGEGI